MNSTAAVFIIMVFLAVFLLAYLLVVPTFGSDSKMRKRLKKRLKDVNTSFDIPSSETLLRKQFLRSLTPTERRLEALPGMPGLGRILDQSGYQMPAYRFVGRMLFAGIGVFLGVAIFTQQILLAIPLGLAGLFAPFMKLSLDRRKRFDKFEEQLPDALDTITRALKAGHPFSEALSLVAKEMEDPIATQFEMTHLDLSYGFDAKTALLNLLERMPSMSVTAMVTSVLIQRETGGNLAEVLQKISAVLRARFRFRRKVKTLSAEGRLSAWILSLMPFALTIMLHLSSPDYLPALIESPTGQKMVFGAFITMFIGLFWISRMIRIKV